HSWIALLTNDIVSTPSLLRVGWLDRNRRSDCEHQNNQRHQHTGSNRFHRLGLSNLRARRRANVSSAISCKEGVVTPFSHSGKINQKINALRERLNLLFRYGVNRPFSASASLSLRYY